MFEAVAAIAAVSLLLGVVVDDELFRLANTLANFATVALIVWHNRHVRKQIESPLKDTAAVVRRQLGERTPAPNGTNGGEYVHTDGYRGPERRKRKVE